VPHRAVLFDLDGTLADTAPDMVGAINALLRERGLPPRPLVDLRQFVSHGAAALIREGFGINPEEELFSSLRQRFLDLYLEGIAIETVLFPGMTELLERLEALDIAWGVVTNKPGWLTDRLIAKLGLAERAGCVVSGDTTAHAKPHPEPLLHASRLLAVPASACLYVGDAERDITAGREAGMRTLIALFGYIGAADRPETWGADGQIDDPLQTLEWLTLPDAVRS